MRADQVSQGLGSGLPDDPSIRVITIVGPRGSGKTTLLQEWARTEKRRVIWFDLAHNQKEMVASIGRQLGRSFRRHFIGAADVVVDLMASEPTVVICDNAESLTNPLWLTAGSSILRIIPTTITAVFAGRSLPALGWSRLRLRDAMLEYGPRDLSEWVNISNPDLDPEVRELAAGWAQAVSLYRDSAATTPEALRSLLDDSLTTLDPADRDLLSLAAVVGPATPELLDSVAGRSGAIPLCTRLRTSPLPMVEVSEHPPTIAVRGALRTLLSDDVAASSPARLQQILVRAADHFSRTGSDVEAFDLMRQSGDRQQLAGLVGRRGTFHILNGRVEVAAAWLREFTDDEVSNDPALLLTAAALRASDGDFGLVDSITLQIDGESRQSAPWSAMYGQVPAPRSTAPTPGAPDATDPSNVPWFLVGQSLIATRQLWFGRLAAAEGILANLTTFARDYAVLDAWRASNQAYLYSLTGRTEKGEAVLRYAGVVIERNGLEDHLWMIPYDAADLRYGIFVKDVPLVRARIASLSKKLARLVGRVPLMRVFSHCSLAVGCTFVGDMAAAAKHVSLAEQFLSDESAQGQLGREIESLKAQVSTTIATKEVGMTAAELRVLHSLVGPETVPQIAEKLFVSPATVRAQIRSIHRKLGTHGRSESVAAARELGLLP